MFRRQKASAATDPPAEYEDNSTPVPEKTTSHHHHHLPRFNHNGHKVTRGIQPDGESGRKGFHLGHFLRITGRSTSKASMIVNILWPFVPVALILHFARPEWHLRIFAISYIAMVPAANLLGFAGQELARKLPRVLGILLEVTLGSVVEIVLFMVLIKLDSGEGNFVPVIQAAILGSILTNLLLCLGLCFFVGGLRNEEQSFHEAISEVGSGLLLVAAFALLIPSAFYSALFSAANQNQPAGGEESSSGSEKPYTVQELQRDTLRISQGVSVILIFAFLVFLWFNTRSNHGLFDEVLETDEQKDRDGHKDLKKAKLTLTECIIAIALSLTFVSLLAVFLVQEIGFMVEEKNIPDNFMGLILVPLVEKAAEHLTAIDEAWDNQMNFALFHCIGPSVQTALLNAPLVVIVGWCLGKPMDLNFEIFFVVLLVLSILVVGNFLRDGKSNYLEGTLLVLVYVIIAVTTWFYPNPGQTSTNHASETNSGA